MEQNSPVIRKKVWKLARAIIFMLKKGINANRKFLLDLNLMMKRGKITGKVFRPPPVAGEYEFSCRNTPPYPLSLFSSTHNKHMKNNHHHRRNINLPAAVDDYSCDDDIIIDPTVIKVLDHMLTNAAAVSSPVDLSGFEMSPLMVTDQGGEDSCRRVDEAADKFIRRFYNDRRREN